MADSFMTLQDARQLRAGDRLTMLVATMGADRDDVERVYPAGAAAVVDTVRHLPVQGLSIHVAIGAGDAMILNVFDQEDAGGLYPFALTS